MLGRLASPDSVGADAPPARSRRWRGASARESGRNVEERRQLEVALAAVLAVAVVGSVLAVGAVHAAVLACVSAVGMAAMVLAFLLARVRRLRPSLAAPLVFLGLSVYSLLQVMPLPAGLLGVIAPSSADIWSRALLPFGEGVRLGRISVDPGATLVEGLKYGLYGGLFYAASVLGARRGAWWGVAIVFGSAVLLAAVTLVHGMAEAHKLFGIYEPRSSFAPSRMSPLLNANNLAGYLNLGALCGMGLLLSRRAKLPRWVCGVGIAAIIGIAVRSASRGGVAALPLGMVLLAGIQYLGQRGDRRERGDRRVLAVPIALLGGAAIAGGVLAVLGGEGWVWRELMSDNMSKLRLVAWAKPLVRDHAWFGIGRGAFESVFAAYRPSPGPNIVFTHPENFVVQWVAEWGVIAAPLALLAFAWLFRPTRLGVFRSAVAAGAWVGVLVLLVQNMVDLGLEIPALPIAAVVALGAVSGEADDRTPRSARDARWQVAALPAQVLLGLLALLTVAVAVWGRHDVAGDREALRKSYEAFAAGKTSAQQVRGEVRASMLRHPADYYFPLVGAAVAWRARDGNPMVWLQRSLERAPINGRAHLLLADVLAARGARRQALFELRLAAEHEPGLTEAASLEVARLARSLEDILVAVPPAPEGAANLDLVAQHLAARHADALREQCDTEALARDPSRLGPRRRRIEARLAALQQNQAEGLCADRAACHRDIEREVAEIRARDAFSSAADMILARLQMAQNDLVAADRILDPACKLPRGRGDCLMLRAQIASTQRAERLDGLLKELATESCATNIACAGAYTWIGDLRSSRGEFATATTSYARAAREDPTEERWMRVADAAEKAGMHVQAVEALEKVAQRRGGPDESLRARIAKNRADAAGHLLR